MASKALHDLAPAHFWLCFLLLLGLYALAIVFRNLCLQNSSWSVKAFHAILLLGYLLLLGLG